MNKTIREATNQEIASLYQSNCISLISRLRKQHYHGFTDMRTGEVLSRCGFTVHRANKLKLGLEYRVWSSNRARKQRLRERIRKMIVKGNCKFLTLTFNDNFLSRETSPETRRRYIARFLKEQCSEYVANIDFGERADKTHREHYHAIVIPKATRIDYAPYCAAFDNSRIYSEDIRVSDKDIDCLSRYINKLTNHSLKASGQYKRLIYSRQ